MDEIRDAELGRELEALAEPEHAPGYWQTVRQQVAAKHQGSGFWAWLRPVFRLRSVRIAVAAAAVAAVAAAVLLAGLPTQGPQPVTADEVLRRAAAVYSSGRTWQADSYLKVNGGQEVYINRILRSSDGSYRLYHYDPADLPVFSVPPYKGRHIVGIEVYDAKSGIYRCFDRPNHVFRIRTECPLGPPDWDLKTSPSRQDVGAMLRGLRASGQVKLHAGVVGGRPVWTVTFNDGQVAGVARSNVDWPVYRYAVDRRTWLPVRMGLEQAGSSVADSRFLRVFIDRPLPADVFSLRMKQGFRVKRYDMGFRRMTLDEARTKPGVLPLVPGFVPGGFKLAHVAVAPWARTENKVVSGTNVFEIQYGAGFDTITLSTRTVDVRSYKPSEDPFEWWAEPGWVGLASQRRLIARGAFSGATAHILVAAHSSQPHLWAVRDGVLLTIGGGATSQELLAIAESLQDYSSAP